MGLLSSHTPEPYLLTSEDQSTSLKRDVEFKGLFSPDSFLRDFLMRMEEWKTKTLLGTNPLHVLDPPWRTQEALGELLNSSAGKDSKDRGWD